MLKSNSGSITCSVLRCGPCMRAELPRSAVEEGGPESNSRAVNPPPKSVDKDGRERHEDRAHDPRVQPIVVAQRIDDCVYEKDDGRFFVGRVSVGHETGTKVGSYVAVGPLISVQGEIQHLQSKAEAQR